MKAGLTAQPQSLTGEGQLRVPGEKDVHAEGPAGVVFAVQGAGGVRGVQEGCAVPPVAVDVLLPDQLP